MDPELEEYKEKWTKEQLKYREQLCFDDPSWMSERLCSGDLLLGGLDISFSQTKSDLAVATIAVIRLKTLELVHERSVETVMQVPYIPTFLGYREVPAFEQLIELLEQDVEGGKLPRLPDVLMIDGNGTLHPRGFGCACQLGHELSIPVFGVAKNLLEWRQSVGAYNTGRVELNELQKSKLNNVGDRVELMNDDGAVCGVVLLPCSGVKRPVFVSPGNNISLSTACDLVLRTSKYRIPEPTRMADLISRKRIRKLDNPNRGNRKVRGSDEDSN